MGKDRGKGGSQAAKGKSSGSAPKGSPGGKDGTSLANPADAAKSLDKEVRDACVKAFGYVKKGNAKQCIKEMDRLIKQYPGNPLPHMGRVRISHRLALAQRTSANLTKQFKECYERASAAVEACPDSILVKLMLVEVVYDDPFASADAMERVRELAEAELPPGAGKSDLKLAKALTRDSFDEEALLLPFFPDINRFQKSEDFIPRATSMLKESYGTLCELHRSTDRLMHQQAVGNGGAEVNEGVRGHAADGLVRLESFMQMREQNHRYQRFSKEQSIQNKEQVKQLAASAKLKQAADIKNNLELRSRTDEAENFQRRAAALEAAKERMEPATPKLSIADKPPTPNGTPGSDAASPGSKDISIVTGAMAKARAAEEDKLRSKLADFAEVATTAKAPKAKAPKTKAEKEAAKAAAKAEREAVAVREKEIREKLARRRQFDSVRKYWKDAVEKDPMAVLSMMDIPLKELREHVDRVSDGPRRADEVKIVRDILQSRIATGKWTRWKCSFPDCCDGGEHLSAEGLYECIEKHYPTDVTTERMGDASYWIAPLAMPHDVNLGGAGSGSGVWPEDRAIPSIMAQSVPEVDDDRPGLVNSATPADIADEVCGRPAPLLSVDVEVYRADAVEEEAVRRRMRRAESRNGVNAGVATDSDEDEDFAEPLIDTAMLRRVATQNHLQVDYNNDREWELPEPLDRDFRKARYALLKDALTRVQEEPGLLGKLREHMMHPELLPPLTGAMTLEFDVEQERLRKQYAQFDTALDDLDKSLQQAVPDFTKRHGDEFLNWFGDCDEQSQLAKGNFKKRIVHESTLHQMEQDNEYKELEQICINSGVNFHEVFKHQMINMDKLMVDNNTQRMASPAARLMKYAQTTNKVREQSIRDAVDRSVADPSAVPESTGTIVRGPSGKDIYVEMLEYLTDTEETYWVYAPFGLQHFKHVFTGSEEADIAMKALEEKAEWVKEHAPLPSWEYQDDPPAAAPEDRERLIEDIVLAMRFLLRSNQMPLRLIHTIAQYISARLRDARLRVDEKEKAGIGLRRRRPKLGAPERVPSDSPDATVGRTSSRTDAEQAGSPADDIPAGSDGICPDDPVRTDNFGARLRMLQTEDLKAMDTLLRQYCGKGSSQSCHDRILVRERQRSSVCLWQMLSEFSALFGITGGVGTESVAEADDARKDGNKKSGKAGKGKKGPKGKGAGEYCVDESSRSLRLCVGAWQALYPMGAMAAIPGLISDAKDEEEAMIRAKTAAAQPKEEFVGENMLKWLYSESSDLQTRPEEEVPSFVMPSDAEFRIRMEGYQNQLKQNQGTFRGIVLMKVVTRHWIDGILTCAEPMLSDRMPLDTIRALDPANPDDEAKLRVFFEDYAKLRYMLKSLRQKLLKMDLHELEIETEHWKQVTLDTQAQHEKNQQKLNELNGPTKYDPFREDRKKDPFEAERFREKQEMQLRLKLTKSKLDEMQQKRRTIGDARNFKEAKLAKLQKSKHFLSAEDRWYRVALKRETVDEIDAAIASWKDSGGNIPPEAMEICRKLQNLPERMTPALVAGQERVKVFDLQMEAILNERSDIIADIEALAQRDHYRWLHPVIIPCLRMMLERRAEAANTAEKEIEQELLLADESKAEEDKKRKEEKAKAKKARDKEEKRLRREKEAAEAAEADAKLRAERDAADAAAKAELEAAAEARAAAKAEADAAEERELQERRRVLEAQEAAEHERMIREMQDLETAQAASLVTAERDAREAQAAERKEIERVVREAEEAEAAAADAEHRAKEEERRRRDEIMAAANAKLKAAKAAEATSIAAAKAAAEAAKIAEEMAREAAEAQALANGDEPSAPQPRLSARASDFTPSTKPTHSFPTSSESSTDSPGDALFDSAGAHGGRGGGRGRGRGGGRGRGVHRQLSSNSLAASETSEEYSSSPRAPPGLPPGMPPMMVGPNGFPVPLYHMPPVANGVSPPGMPPGFTVPYGYPPGMVPPPGYPHGCPHGPPGMVHTHNMPPTQVPGAPPHPGMGPPPLPPGPPPAANQLANQRPPEDFDAPAPPPAASAPPAMMKFGEHSAPMDPNAYAQYQAHYQAHAAAHAQMQNGELNAYGQPVTGETEVSSIHGVSSVHEANARAASEAARIAAEDAARFAKEATRAAEEAAEAGVEVSRLADDDYPALALPGPAGSDQSSAGSVDPNLDDGGFAVDELQAALEASMRETRKERPKQGYARIVSGEQLDAMGGSGGRDSPQVAEGPGAGLRNLEGEYNCFLNVVIQSLWHLPPFSRAVQGAVPKGGSEHAWNGNGRLNGSKDPDAEVAAALRDVFRAMDQSNADSNADVPLDTQTPNAVAPTALRKALAVLTKGRESLFGENEMADASEALHAIFHSVHRALRPPPGTKHARPLTNSPSSKSGGMFLDQEAGYCSVVHRCFGVDVEESMTCVQCAVRSRTLRYTKFLHLVPAAALNLAMSYADGVDSMESAMRHIDGSDAKPCDVDAGGCGAMNGIKHALCVDGTNRKSPAIFCVALAWESASATSEQVAETLANVQTTLNLAEIFERAPADARTYHLRCAMCYYGEHYAAFAVTDAGRFDGHERWMLFDDHRSKEVGEWEEVVRSCSAGRMQPCVLFYQRENATVEV